MRLKKAISLSFLLLANVITLVHVAIPHCHHSNMAICFTVAHCERNDVAHSHSHNAGCHRHDDGGGLEECPLKDLYVRHENITSFVDEGLDAVVQYPVLFVLAIGPVAEITDLEGLPFRQHPISLSCYTDYISCSLGLRAPPFC